MLDLFFLIFHLIGLAILVWALVALRRSKAAALWPSTPGEVQSSELSQYVDEGDLISEVKVSVIYEVKGKDFSTTRIAFGYGADDKAKMHENLSARLAEGTKVKVYYDPEDPSQAVLINSKTAQVKGVFVFAVAWIMLSAGMHAFAVEMSKPDPSTIYRFLCVVVMALGVFGSLFYFVRNWNQDDDLTKSLEVLS